MTEPVIPENLIIRCHDCGGTQIWKRTDAGELETYHGCFNGKQSREAFAALEAQLSAAEQKVEASRKSQDYWKQEHLAGNKVIESLEQKVERAMDLVRFDRRYLFDEKLIDEQEYAALVADSESGQRVARLETYDQLRQKVERLSEALKSIAANICCDSCREAALVARAALAEKE
jgi:hypothetical protein